MDPPSGGVSNSSTQSNDDAVPSVTPQSRKRYCNPQLVDSPSVAGSSGLQTVLLKSDGPTANNNAFLSTSPNTITAAASKDISEKHFRFNPSGETRLESSKFASLLLSKLNDLRANGELCDLILYSTDNTEFPVHRTVLVAASDYFKAMQRVGMKESKEDIIKLQAISTVGLQAIIEFAYTGLLTLTQGNVQDVLSAATHLQVEEAIDLCTGYLESLVSTDTCLDILNIAEMYSLESVMLQVNAFLLEKFDSFAETDNFYQLRSSQLMALIRDNRLRVTNEYRLFEWLHKWIYHNPDERLKTAADLIRFIRLPLLSGEELVEKVSHVPFMKTNKVCNELLTEAKDYHIVVGKQPLMQNPRTQVRSDQQSLVMCHAENLEAYNLNTKRHSFLKDCVIAMYNPSVCVIDNFLYVCGGRYDCNEHSEIASARCFRYDPRFDVWFELNPMTEARKDFVLLAIGRELFAFGGQDENMVMCTVERYAISHYLSNDWDMRISMRHALFCHAGTVNDGMAYISGGQRHDGFSQGMACYNPTTNVWTDCATMLNKRGNHLMEAVNGRIFVLGGNVEDTYGFPVPVVSVEMFDIEANQWSILSSTLNIREAGSSVCGDKIFIAGGLDGDHYFSHALQVYDTQKDAVCLKDRFPTRIYGRACSILVLPQCS